MSKKKSKPRSLSQQHLAQAQHRNRYWEKIKFICQACGTPQAFISIVFKLADSTTPRN